MSELRQRQSQPQLASSALPMSLTTQIPGRWQRSPALGTCIADSHTVDDAVSPVGNVPHVLAQRGTCGDREQLLLGVTWINLLLVLAASDIGVELPLELTAVLTGMGMVAVVIQILLIWRRS